MIQLKEALIGKHNINNASSKNLDLFIVDSYSDFYEYCIKNYSDKKIGAPQEEIFILDLNEVKDILDNVKSLVNFDFHVYPINHLSKKDIKNLKDDLEDTRYFTNVIDKYKLEEIDTDEL